MSIKVGDRVLVIWNNKIQPALVTRKLPLEIRVRLEESQQEMWFNSNMVVKIERQS